MFIGILSPAYHTQASTSPISIAVTAFEYAVFRWAPFQLGECQEFRYRIFQHEDIPADGNYLKVDCKRYQNAMKCYNAFYPLLNDTNISEKNAKLDLDRHNLLFMKETCS